MPMRERTSRMDALAKRLPGLQLTEVYEPAFSLIDLFAGMVDDNELRYVPWSACISREAELRGTKKTK
eukprot:986116-Amphidinium_carterae.1